MSDDAALLRLLKETRNFEKVLGDVRRESVRGTTEHLRLTRLQNAVLATFAEMNEMLAAATFEFQFRHRERFVVEFLSTFDAIFTLNQDLLLELHYFPGATSEQPKRWRGTFYPGVATPQNWTQTLPAERLRSMLTTSDVAQMPDHQPIYKLHGSVNWRSPDGASMIVIGDGKQSTIDGTPLLARYFEGFRRYLCAGSTKIMVIGYSFSDEHVNVALTEASNNHDLQTYLVNPSGLSLFDPPREAMIKPRNALYDSLRLVGLCTRPFRDAFSSDHLSFNSFQRFLAS